MIAEQPQSTLAPGLYPNVPFEDYLAWRLMSQSVLKQGQHSMLHLKAAYDGDAVVSVTDDMRLGSALHVAFLEPEQAADRVVLWEGDRRAGKEWQAFKEEHDGKVILTKGYYANLCGMVAALRKHPFVRDWVSKIEDVEVSGVGEVRGVMMKGRCDALTPEPLIDLKKVSSADLGSFTRIALRLGYHMQAHIYRTLFNRERFVLIAVEDAPPFDVVAYELSPAMLRHGEREVNGLLDRYKFALRENKWPGRAEDVIQMELPEWAVSADEFEELTIDGERAF